MARDAYPFLIPLSLISLLGFVFGVEWIGLFFLALTIFVAFFFRDPDRLIPTDSAAIVSPADGKVVGISKDPDGLTRVSIFLSVFNVHINRSPIEGRVESVQYRPGKFKVAFDEIASVENEQNILIVSNGATRIKFSQIAGILARRIVCWKKQGETVDRGERIGLIKFGSRVDVFLPDNVSIEVRLGDRVSGGSSIIGRIS